MQLIRFFAFSLVGLTGVLASSPSLAQAAPAGEDGVILDLEALESLKKEETVQDAESAYIVPYGPGAVEPAPEAKADISRVAEAAEDSTARLTIVAYASKAEGGSENDARRLALRRAIALRQILVAAGIDGSRVNLRPMGLRTEGSGSSDQAEIIIQRP